MRSFLNKVNTTPLHSHHHTVNATQSTPLVMAVFSIAQQTPAFDWDELYGKRGELLVELARTYDYDSMHITMRSTPWLGFDSAIATIGYVALALRWGDFPAVTLAIDRILPAVRWVRRYGSCLCRGSS